MLTKKKEKDILITEYKQFSHLRVLSLILMGIMIVGLVAGTIFVYNNIFTAISKAQANLKLEVIANAEAVNFTRYEKVKADWEKKQAPIQITIIRDPLNPIQQPEEEEE